MAIIRGGYDGKVSKQIVENAFIDGELQKSIEEIISQNIKLLMYNQMRDGMIMIRYEE